MSGGFEDLGLLPELVRATQEQGWILPSDVQDETIPLILGGGDVMVAAETGSGKTGAFALPAIQIVHETRRSALLARTSSSSSSSTKSTEKNDIKLNLNDRTPTVAISNDGFIAQCRQEKDWGGVRANTGVLKGNIYYEVSMRDEGLCRVGWSSSAAALDLGTDKFGYGYGGTGKKSNNRNFESYGEEFKMNDIIGCLLSIGDDKSTTITWSKNGKIFPNAFTFNSGGGAFYPAVCMKNAELLVNFGQSPFKYLPSGYVGIINAPVANLMGPSINSNGNNNNSKKSGCHPVCLVLEPARDLALQTGKAFDELKKYVISPNIGCGTLIGGMSNGYVKEQLNKGTDIMIATPQILLASIKDKDIELDQVRLLILDEADRFTEKENLEMIDKLYKTIRTSIDTTVPGRLQVCFFSATLHSPEIANLSTKLCNHPTWVDLKGKDSVPETVHHVIISVDPSKDRSWVKNNKNNSSSNFNNIDVPTDNIHQKDNINGQNKDLSKEEKSEGVKQLKPRMLVSLIDSLRMTQCLIFCRTNLDCDNLEDYLTKIGGGNKWRPGMEKGKENPYSCCVLAGMRSQEQRNQNLQAFKDGDVRFLICTDVAARGLDIKELPYVINMTLPDETENYIHRIGRVGRADRMGLAISLVSVADEKVWYHTCDKNRGKGCTNTNIVNMNTKSGGCATWYDEPSKLQQIIKRLAMISLPEMECKLNSTGPTGKQQPYVFTLPKDILDLGAEYGEEKGNKQETSAHVLAIASQVDNLLKLEVHAQSSYLALKLKYRK